VAVGTSSVAIPAFANIDPPRMFQLQARFVFADVNLAAVAEHTAGLPQPMRAVPDTLGWIRVPRKNQSRSLTMGPLKVMSV